MIPVKEETEDEVMTEAAMLATSTSAMQTSVQLAEKLKKHMAMDMSMSMAEAMDIDKEEQRKQLRAGCLVIDIMLHTPKSPTVVDLPEIKKSRNDKTPTPHAKVKAFFSVTQAISQPKKRTTSNDRATTQEDNHAPQPMTMHLRRALTTVIRQLLSRKWKPPARITRKHQKTVRTRTTVQ